MHQDPFFVMVLHLLLNFPLSPKITLSGIVVVIRFQ